MVIEPSLGFHDFMETVRTGHRHPSCFASRLLREPAITPVAHSAILRPEWAVTNRHQVFGKDSSSESRKAKQESQALDSVGSFCCFWS